MCMFTYVRRCYHLCGKALTAAALHRAAARWQQQRRLDAVQRQMARRTHRPGLCRWECWHSTELVVKHQHACVDLATACKLCLILWPTLAHERSWDLLLVCAAAAAALQEYCDAGNLGDYAIIHGDRQPGQLPLGHEMVSWGQQWPSVLSCWCCAFSIPSSVAVDALPDQQHCCWFLL